MSILSSLKSLSLNHHTSPEVRIGSKRIKLSFGPFLVVKDYLKAMNARRVGRAHAWRQEATSKGQALNASQIAPSDLLYRIKL